MAVPGKRVSRGLSAVTEDFSKNVAFATKTADPIRGDRAAPPAALLAPKHVQLPSFLKCLTDNALTTEHTETTEED
jgi:hypothetical protein